MDPVKASVPERTTIYRFRATGEDAVGYVLSKGIYRLRWQEGTAIGRCEFDDVGGRIFRTTRFGEKELGGITLKGIIHSHGLFEGGNLGWLEPDGTVLKGGYIFAEEEVGRVEGPQEQAAAAALMLIFLPEEEEEDREAKRFD